MSDVIRYSQSNLDDLASRIESLSDTLDSIRSQLQSVDTSSRAGGSQHANATVSLSGLGANRAGGSTVRECVTSYANSVSACSGYISGLGRAVRRVNEEFYNTETNQFSSDTSGNSSGGTGGHSGGGGRHFGEGTNSESSSSWLDNLIKVGKHLPNILLGGGLQSKINDLLNTELGSFNFSHSIKDGNWSALGLNITGKATAGGISGSLSAYLLRNHTEGSSKYGGFSNDLTIGGGSASGKVGLSLFDGKKFSPKIFADVSGEAYALRDTFSGHVGGEDINASVDAEGTLLGMDGSAKFNADFKKGVVEAKVGGEAYVAKGKASGTINIFGVKIKVSGEAMVGVNATAGGKVGKNSASGSVGLGPFKVSVDVDWSKFNPVKAFKKLFG